MQYYYDGEQVADTNEEIIEVNDIGDTISMLREDIEDVTLSVSLQDGTEVTIDYLEQNMDVGLRRNCVSIPFSSLDEANIFYIDAIKGVV